VILEADTAEVIADLDSGIVINLESSTDIDSDCFRDCQ